MRLEPSKGHCYLHVGLSNHEVIVAGKWYDAEDYHDNDIPSRLNCVTFESSCNSTKAQESVEATDNKFKGELTSRVAKCVYFETG